MHKIFTTWTKTDVKRLSYVLLVTFLVFNKLHSQTYIDTNPHRTFASHFSEFDSDIKKVTDWYRYSLKEKVESIEQESYRISTDKSMNTEEMRTGTIELQGGYNDKIITFNTNGNLIDIITKYGNRYYPQTFDYQKNIKEFHDRVSDGYVKGIYQWNDEKGLPLSFEGGVYGHLKYEYNKNSITQTSYKEKECHNIFRTTTFLYNPTAKVIEVNIKNSDNSFFQRKKIFYNSKGHKIKLQNYNRDGQINSYQIYTYNEKEDIKELKEYSGNSNKPSTVSLIEYEYDSKNNWILRKETGTKINDTLVIERKISYYN